MTEYKDNEMPAVYYYKHENLQIWIVAFKYLFFLKTIIEQQGIPWGFSFVNEFPGLRFICGCLQ
jgi:hypothetical protein